MEVQPKTGRFHQIRAQLAHLGCPIVGDEKYCAEPDLEVQRIHKLNRLCLHAYQLNFVHPTTKKNMTLVADYSDQLKGIIKKVQTLNS